MVSLIAPPNICVPWTFIILPNLTIPVLPKLRVAVDDKSVHIETSVLVKDG